MKKSHIVISLSLFLAAVVAMIFVSARSVAVLSLFMATVVWWIFVGWYAVRAKWYRLPQGRNVMSVSFGLSVVLTLFSFGVLFGRFFGYEIIWALAFLTLTVAGVQRIYHVERIQRHVGKWKDS